MLYLSKSTNKKKEIQLITSAPKVSEGDNTGLFTLICIILIVWRRKSKRLNTLDHLKQGILILHVLVKHTTILINEKLVSHNLKVNSPRKTERMKLSWLGLSSPITHEQITDIE